ncbi:MAG: Gfo/Idh/MocA family oxidoreductase [Nitriliruptoraceae bacterium]
MTGPRIAVIGAGFMGARWARVIAESGHAELAIIADLDEATGRAVADEFGAQWSAEPLEAASDEQIDGVVVATPEHLHAEVTLAAIAHDKVVAVEKPLAHTVDEAQRIADAAAQAGVPVLAGHVLRFEPRYAAIRAAIERGEIGQVQAIRSERVGLIADQQILQGRTTIALYYGVHEFDLARWYAGDVAEVWATRSTGVVAAHGYDVDDLYSVGLRFSDGAHGTSMVGWCLPSSVASYGLSGFTVIGDQGILKISQNDTGYVKVGADGPVHDDVHYSPIVHGRIRGAVANEVEHFIDCVRGIAEPICTANDGAAAVRVALAMERSADTHAAVTIDPP